MIKGEKVILREKRKEDALQDYVWRCDPELARYDATLPLHTTFEDYLIGYEEVLRYPNTRRKRFAIETLEGKHIGNCTYYDIDEGRKQAELGILIGEREYWGKGYGTDVVSTLLRYIFATTDIERVYLHTLDWNLRAQKCFQKCGFVEVDRVRYDSYDFVRMEVHRSDLDPKPG